MYFAKTILATLAVASQALAISISGPSSSAFWVEDATNIISWTFNSGDPNPISITVANPNSSLLQGNFSIAQFVKLDNGSFTVTNVTLKVGSGYVVNFVNPSNETQIVASSEAFDVKAPGTPPATTSSSSSAASSTSTSPSGTSSSTSGAANTQASNAAGRAVSFDLPMLPILSSFGMAIVGALIAL